MAETKAILFTDGKFQAVNNSGEVVPYGKLYFFDSVSGNVITTYTTSTMETENTHPIILSASGKGDVYIGDGQFDVTLQDKNGATVWTINNYIPPGGQVQLDPVTSITTKEERTGITGNSLILENVPLTAIDIHKDGLYLLTTEYEQDNRVVVFDDPLIATDELIITYGILAPGETVQSEWVYQTLIFTYISSSSFKTNGDTTSLFLDTRRVKLDLLASSSYAEVVSSTYDGGNDETTVVVSTTAMDNTLVEVGYAIVSPFLDSLGGSLSFYTRAEVDAAVATRRELYAKETTTHNIALDSDYTLTSEQNNFGKIIITDTGVILTGAINIIMSDDEKDFVFHNDTAEVLTVKTSAGTGVEVPIGITIWLLSDGTNIIESVSPGITAGPVAETKIGDFTVGESISVSSWSYVATVITINTSSIHNLSVGQFFRVSGLVATTNAPNDTRWVVTEVIDGDTVKFTADDTPTGTPTVSSALLKHGDIEFHGASLGKNACTAWVTFDGTATPPTILDSFNINDVVRTATGQFELYFSSAMDNINYTFAGTVYTSGGTALSVVAKNNGSPADTIDKVGITTGYQTIPADVEYTRVNIFGGKN